LSFFRFFFRDFYFFPFFFYLFFLLKHLASLRSYEIQIAVSDRDGLQKIFMFAFQMRDTFLIKYSHGPAGFKKTQIQYMPRWMLYKELADHD